MVNQHSPEMKTNDQHDSNYDEPWKAFIINHFRLFLSVFFPKLTGKIDWSIAPVFDPTEISQFLGIAKRRNKFVDIVVQVTLLTGEQKIVLLHFEVQTEYSQELGRRLYLLNCGLQWQFPDLDVISLVVRTDLAKKWSKLKYCFKLGGYCLRTRFPTCKISEMLATTWKDDFSLPVMVARAQIEALKTTSDAEARYEAKKRLIRMLYDRRYERDEVLEILRYLDWMMHLSEDLECRLREEMRAIKSQKYPEMTEYVHSWERMARKEGEEKGKKEGIKEGVKGGKLEMVFRLLEKRCGKVPEPLSCSITELAMERLDELFDDALSFDSVEDLSKWLAK